MVQVNSVETEIRIREFTLDGHVYTPVRAFRGYRDDVVSIRLLVASDTGKHRSAIFKPQSTGAERRSVEADLAASRLEEYSGFARHLASGVIDLDGVDYRIWIEDWVQGIRLKDLLHSSVRRFGLTEFRQLIVDLASALAALRAQNVQHGEISVETLILSEPPSGSLIPEYTFTVANLSSARTLQTIGSENSDDRDTLAVIAEAYNALYRAYYLPIDLRRYLRQVRDYLLLAAQGIADGDRLDLLALRRLGSGPRQDQALVVQASSRLNDPFDFFSAEHLGSDVLFHKVFTYSGSWLEELRRPVPTLVQGPRGCGKSMALRWLSLKTQLAGSQPLADIDESEIAGFYVACASELQSRVAHLTSLDLAKKNRGPLQHYLNMVLLREVSSTLVQLAAQNRMEWGLGQEAARALFGFVASEVKASTTSAAGVDLWEQTRDLAQMQLSYAHDALEGREIPFRLTIGSFLHDLARTLTENVPFFASKRIAYCLDDYSAHRIPEAVQQIFNEIVFSVRSGNHVFKISAENRGFYPYLSNGARIDVQREMTTIDVGSAFLEASIAANSPSRDFARELLANRLRAAEWKGTPDSLLGRSRVSNAQFARDARADRRPLYAGIDMIADLCSGDVAHLLLLYKRIFKDAEVDPSSTGLIEDHLQDRAIRQVSKALLEAVRSSMPLGPDMLELVDQFCQLARWMMVDGPTVVEHGQNEPRKQTRIEVDGLSVPDYGTVQDRRTQFFVELLRRAILIELRPGIARRGDYSDQSQLSVRLMLRRIYLPAYELSLSKNIAWKWTQSEFGQFLDDPRHFTATLQRRIVAAGRASAGPDDYIPGLE